MPTKEEFEHYSVALSLSGMFYETDITYTWEEFQQHLAQTRAYANDCAHFDFSETSSHAFRNLQIYMHEGKWAMISKNKAPAIHFVIHHPKLREAIENFIPPFVEG